MPRERAGSTRLSPVPARRWRCCAVPNPAEQGAAWWALGEALPGKDDVRGRRRRVPPGDRSAPARGPAATAPRPTARGRSCCARPAAFRRRSTCSSRPPSWPPAPSRKPPQLGDQGSRGPGGRTRFGLSCRIAGDATRTFSEGVLTAALEGGRGPELVAARQLPDGTVHLAGATAEGVQRLRPVSRWTTTIRSSCAACRDDALLGPSPARAAHTAPAALGASGPGAAPCAVRPAHPGEPGAGHRACRGARSRPGGRRLGCASSRTAVISAASPRRSCMACGLHARRGAVLARVCRSLELERLRELPTDAVAAPWPRAGPGASWVGARRRSACRAWAGASRGLEGDLGLVKLLSGAARAGPSRRGDRGAARAIARRVGRAGQHLLAGLGRGLVRCPRPAA